MGGATSTRIGGLCGLVAAVVVIPAYLVGTPESPRTPVEATRYYDSGSWFVTANGVLPLLHILFGLLFLGVLVAVLRAASGPAGAVYVALAGGALYLGLGAAGFAAEVAVPATLLRFGDVTVTGFSQPLLTLSVWLYHYSQVGAAAMIFASSVVIWRTGVLPKWTAAGAVLGVLPLLHTWAGLSAAVGSLIWIAGIGLVLLAVAPRTALAGSVVA
ncbi:MAG TPA: hypothetical protein VGH99_16320 [Pseudonocardia sp.]|jgi:hypothetical protein